MADNLIAIDLKTSSSQRLKRAMSYDQNSRCILKMGPWYNTTTCNQAKKRETKPDSSHQEDKMCAS